MSVVEAAHPKYSSHWPALPLNDWRDTRETLHRWMQIVGKVQLGLTPLINHWWNVPFRITSRGLATSAMPYGDRWFEIEFDFLADALRIRVNDGHGRDVPLGPRSVADFYRETMAALHELAIDIHIWPVPVEIENPIRLDRDGEHRSYDKPYVMRFWEIVARTAEVLETFRGRFVGKASPVQFFWGTFDLATGRFSGRRAPPLNMVSAIEREAYSHEVISAGWWPGDSRLPHAAFYSYAAPEPPGFASAQLGIPHAAYNPALRGFYLHHDVVCASATPEQLLLDFFQRSYAAAAELAGWDRPALEREAA